MKCFDEEDVITEYEKQLQKKDNEIERLTAESTEWESKFYDEAKKVDKAIFFLNNECMYSKDLGYCDDLWCGRVKDLVNILKGEDE